MHMNKDGTLDVEGDLRKTIATLEQRVADLKKQLVERDVYEAQQILPPEQAALIKHLATVERCIEDGREEFHGYDIEVRCIFCHRDDEEHAHEKDCAWLALQFDRKPAETMALVEGWAWEENARRDRDRERARAMALGRRRGKSDMVDAALYGLGRIRVETNPLVPPGTARSVPDYAALGDPLDLEATSEHPVDTAVAPPDDEDVP